MMVSPWLAFLIKLMVLHSKCGGDWGGVRIWGRVTASGGGLHALAGLPDVAGLVPMDPAEVPDQSDPRRRAARDHQPAFRGARGRCVERVDTLRSIRNFVVLVSTAAADRARVTPCPSRIQLAEV